MKMPELATRQDDTKQGMIRHQRNLLIGLGVLTVIVNAAVLFIVIPELSRNLAPFYNQDRFADGYDQLAANLADGHGYRFYPETARTVMREPGYPVLLAGIFVIFGDSFTAVKLVNMILALATAWLMTRIVRRLSSRQAFIFVPPLLFLFHPATLIAESRGAVEILFTFLTTLFMLTLYRAMESNRWLVYAVSGAVLGMAVLVKSTVIMLPLVLLAYLLVIERRRNPTLSTCGHIAIMVIAMFVVLSPWITRNYLLTKRFIPTASVLGVSAHAGQYICTHLASGQPWVLIDREASRERGKLARDLGYRFKEDDPYYQVFYSTEDEVNFSRHLAKKVFGEYATHPLLCMKCAAYNLFNFWCAGKTWQSTGMSLAVQLPYLGLGLVGVILSVKRGQAKVIGPLVLFITYVVAVHVPILAQARYSVPLIPYLSMLAAVPLVAGWRKVAGSDGLGEEK